VSGGAAKWGTSPSIGTPVVAAARVVAKAFVQAGMGAIAGGATAAIAGGVVENHRLNVHDEEVQACRAKATPSKPPTL
jgi:hypothetical protein